MKNTYVSSKESSESTVFSEKEHDMLYRLEADSWWFQYRAKVIVGLMRRNFHKDVATIDVGGGNGYTTSVAAKNGFNMKLLEPAKSACENAAKRGIEAICGMLTDDYPSDDAYGQVLLLDVLEHIEDDSDYLSLMHRKISDGGVMLITVPAFMCLWSSQDEYAGHYRRYKLNELTKKVEDAGFTIKYSNYFMNFLFLPVLIGRRGMERIGLLKRNENRTEAERSRIYDKQFKVKRNSLVNSVMEELERVEYKKLIKEKKIKFGSSAIVIAQKTKQEIEQCL